MPKKSHKKRPKQPPKDSPNKLRPDVAETAYRVMLEATGQIGKTGPSGRLMDKPKNPAAVKLGKKGGRVGGKARARALSAQERSRSAQNAAQARWCESGKETSI